MSRVLFIACTFFFLHILIVAENGTTTTKRPRGNRTHGFYRAGAVTNSETCTNVALDILDDDGSAVDAAIAALLCEGLTNPQSMGVGGGFLMTIYDADAQQAHVLNAREVAPAAANASMFQKTCNLSNCDELTVGGLAAAVPGEVMGYWEAHQRFGKISWYDLFRPAIDLAAGGVPITKYTSDMIAKIQESKNVSPSMMAFLTNPETRIPYTVGDVMQRPTLAETLDIIAQIGPEALYNGCLTEDFIRDIRESGGIMTAEDLRSYKAIWQPPVMHIIGDYVLYSASTPGSGDLLMYAVDVMAQKLCDIDVQFWHRFVETWKLIFGIRASYSGGPMNAEAHQKSTFDPNQIKRILENIVDSCTSNNAKDYLMNSATTTAPEDHGTSQICIYAPNGDAVSVTSTINLSFGAQFISESTGIILNNEMMDFTVPDEESPEERGSANQVIPGHYPMSSMIPTIVVDPRLGKVRLVIGAAGGFKILTSVSMVVLQNLYMGIPLGKAVRTKRLHHQLMPMVVEYEQGFDESVLLQLEKRGHVVQSLTGVEGTNSSSGKTLSSCVNAISIIDEKIRPVGDIRRNAYAGGL